MVRSIPRVKGRTSRALHGLALAGCANHVDRLTDRADPSPINGKEPAKTSPLPKRQSKVRRRSAKKQNKNKNKNKTKKKQTNPFAVLLEVFDEDADLFGDGRRQILGDQLVLPGLVVDFVEHVLKRPLARQPVPPNTHTHTQSESKKKS